MKTKFSLTILSNSLRVTLSNSLYLKKRYHEMPWCTSYYLMKGWFRILLCYNTMKIGSKAKWKKTQCKNILTKESISILKTSQRRLDTTPFYQKNFRHTHLDLRRNYNLSIITLSKGNLDWSAIRTHFMQIIKRKKRRKTKSSLTTRVFWKMVKWYDPK